MNIGENTQKTNIIQNNLTKLFSDNKIEFTTDYIGNFQSYLDSLSTVEQGALASLAFAITVYYCAIGIAIDYYSDKLRIYLNLEHTMPRLAR